LKKIGTDIKYIGRIKAFDCKKCGQPLWMMGCGNPECEDYWKKDEIIKCKKCEKPLSTYGCVNSNCSEYYDIREVPIEFITAMIDEHGINHKLNRDQNLYLSKEDDVWVACDNTDGDCFVESYKSKERATRYLMGEDPEELAAEEELENNAYNVK